ncbi:hypothetical protein [Herbidospora mongoliensis]|uniref:hypothetical protein n=1 Tax=Herbidospora mongoliensis TaxID=688067 RepID=UPI00082D9DA6|nr:hypothetical protein [Herbidospora mongoliensis]
MTIHIHTRNAIISLGQVLSDGARHHQLWHICPCMLPKLRHRLGKPDEESFASPQAAAEIAAVTETHPGLIRQVR